MATALVTAFFHLVARRCEQSDPAAAERLRRASTHWLRHTFATRIVTMTRDVVLGRDLLGHDSIATTSIYLDGTRSGSGTRWSDWWDSTDP